MERGERVWWVLGAFWNSTGLQGRKTFCLAVEMFHCV